MTDSVLITGASTGLGLETAVHLAERGFKVYGTMRNLERRGNLDAEASRRNVSVEVLQLDVTDKASIDRAVSAIIAESGGIYGLVNNAGIDMHGYFEDLTDEETRRPFETNVFGMMEVTRAVLPHMRKAGRGRIVVISSIGGRVGSMGVSVYCASRFAQEGFAESLSQEVQPLGIWVSLVEPGVMNTQHWTSSNFNVAKRARNPDGPYYDWYIQVEKLLLGLVDSSSIKTSEVATAVLKALTAKRPRLRYLVGRKARLVVALRRYAPAGLFERFYFGTIIKRVTRSKHD